MEERGRAVSGDQQQARDPAAEEYWGEYLGGQPDTLMHFGRRVLTRLPSDPRCRLCSAPFAGPGAPIMRAIGKRPSDGNPNVCATCQDNLIRHHGGAEVEGALMFADIRGSTTLAEQMTPTEFRELIDRFYSVATRAVFKHDGVVDKFVGDELVAMFYSGLAGRDFVRQAVEAALEILRGTGHGPAAEPWVPVGAGVNSGRAWFGAVGEGNHVELTALGDTVNVAARLASAAKAGEVLVSVGSAAAAGISTELERRRLDLKGKSQPVDVVVVTVGADLAASKSDGETT